jgi:plasmid stabilization system protein ParE
MYRDHGHSVDRPCPAGTSKSLRSFPYRDYVICYEVRAEAVRILCVLHARRDIEHLDSGEVT